MNDAAPFTRLTQSSPRRTRTPTLLFCAALCLGVWGLEACISPEHEADSQQAALFHTLLELRLAEALTMNQAMLRTLGFEHPSVFVEVGGVGAYATPNGIVVGSRLIETVPSHTLAQILAHEAGHIFDGHVDPFSNWILEQAASQGLISPARHSELLHSQELAADIWGALSAWLFDPTPQTPGLSQWLREQNQGDTHTHPNSEFRADLIENMVPAFEALAQLGLFTGMALLSHAAYNHQHGDYNWRDLAASLGNPVAPNEVADLWDGGSNGSDSQSHHFPPNNHDSDSDTESDSDSDIESDEGGDGSGDGSGSGFSGGGE